MDCTPGLLSQSQATMAIEAIPAASAMGPEILSSPSRAERIPEAMNGRTPVGQAYQSLSPVSFPTSMSTPSATRYL